jgi:hypothetical protein
MFAALPAALGAERLRGRVFANVNHVPSPVAMRITRTAVPITSTGRSWTLCAVGIRRCLPYRKASQQASKFPFENANGFTVAFRSKLIGRHYAIAQGGGLRSSGGLDGQLTLGAIEPQGPGYMIVARQLLSEEFFFVDCHVSPHAFR